MQLLKLTSIIAVLAFIGVKSLHAQELYPKIDNDQKWGYVNESKATIIPYEYDYAARFSNELARVKKAGKYGFINRHNEAIIPCIYKNAKDFSEGLAAVYNGKGWGYINTVGIPITPFTYRKTTPFSKGRAFVVVNLKYALIDSTGRRCTELLFDDAKPFIGPHTTVKQRGLYALINLKGEVIDSLYSACWPFRRAEYDSLAFCVARRTEEWSIRDENMQVVWRESEDSIASILKDSLVVSSGLYLSVSDQKINICRKREIHNAVSHGALTFCDSLPGGEQIVCTIAVLPGENLYIKLESENSDQVLGWSLEGLGGRHFTSLEPKNILPLKDLTPSYYKIEFFTLLDGEESESNRLEYRFYPIEPFH